MKRSITLTFLLYLIAHPGSVTLSGENQNLVEIRVHDTASADDDYITWAPTVCTIRVRPDSGVTEDLKVVLTNDPPQDEGKDGDLKFALTVQAGKTADKDQITLTLKKDGAPEKFFIAGKFDHPSSKDKDAIIQAHKDTADGAIVGTHALMVRVRKNASKLSKDERDAFLDAIAMVKASGVYKALVDMHTVATGSPTIPDQAHRDAGFLPWHRAFLLQYERELQKIHPHVALHYWREDEQSKIFTPDFMGRNAVSTTNPFQLVDVELNSDNPLFNWKIEGVSLHRASFDRTDLFWVNPEADVIAPTAYRESGNNFSRGLEGNPHNDGHGWVGGWMADCQTSPRDPVFWLFHCDIDRLWAKWQWTHNRFGTDGNDEKDYFPNDAYAAGSSVPFGHHLEDTMWPWDKKTGEQNAADPNDNRPDSGKEALFAKSGIPGVWPEEDASPQVKTMIDYFGAGGGNINLGFCYDDVPFGKKTENTPPLAGGSINAFADPTASWNARIRAGRNLRGSISVSERQKLKKILKTRSESDPIRRLALLRLNRDRASTWIPPAIEVITKRNNGGASLRSSIVEQLGIAAMFTPEGRKQKKQIFQTLEKLIDRKESLAVRLAAISPLLRMRNPKALALIKTSIRNPGKGVIPRSQAIRMLGLAQPGKNHDLFRPLLKKSVPNPVRIAALHVTGGDAESREVRRSIATAQSEPYRVRLVALQSLMHSDPDFPNLAIKIVKDVDENTSIRRVALAGIRIHAIANAKKLKKPGLEKVKQLLSTQRSGNRALSNSLKQAGLKLDQLIKRHQ